MDALAARRIETARYQLLLKEPFYGTMMSLVDYTESRSIPTIGVAAKKTGFVCYYNPDFIHALYELHGKEARGFMRIIMKHEVEHIVRLHMSRRASRNPDAWNIAADGIIHGNAKSYGNSFAKLKNMGDNFKPIFLDDLNISYSDTLTTEEVYSLLMNNSKVKKVSTGMSTDCPLQGPAGNTDGGKGSNGNEMECPADYPEKGSANCPKGGFNTLDDHATWGMSDTSQSEQREMTKSLVQQGVQAGTAPGHLKATINSLMSPVINWKHELRSFTGRHCGSRRTTFARANRRYRNFGTKGLSRHAAVPLTICVDTSGSISDKMLHMFFSEIESAAYRFKIMLIQFDHEVQDIRKYRRGDWKKIEAKGRGGTSFINLFNTLQEKGLVGKANVILTDGYAEDPGPLKFPTKWFITHDGAMVEGHDCIELPHSERST